MLHCTVSACVFLIKSCFLRASALEDFSCKCYFSFFYVEVTKFSSAIFASPQSQYFFCMHCDVCCTFACWVVSHSLPLFPIAMLSLFDFVMSVAVSHSFTPALKAVVTSRSLSVCLMLCPSASLLCFSCDITALFSLLSQYLSCHLSVASVLCEVILLPSQVLSLHYLLGYLSAVVPVLSYATIKVVTFSPWQHLKMLSGMC